MSLAPSVWVHAFHVVHIIPRFMTFTVTVGLRSSRVAAEMQTSCQFMWNAWNAGPDICGVVSGDAALKFPPPPVLDGGYVPFGVAAAAAFRPFERASARSRIGGPATLAQRQQVRGPGRPVHCCWHLSWMEESVRYERISGLWPCRLLEFKAGHFSDLTFMPT